MATTEPAEALPALWNRLKAIAADAPAGDEAIEAYLARPTDAVCRFCGRQYLAKWEALNRHTCDSCRRAYLAKAEPEKTADSVAEALDVPVKYRRMRPWAGGLGPELEAFRKAPAGLHLVTGTPGTGKTLACTTVLVALAMDGVKVRWCDALEISLELRSLDDRGRLDLTRRLAGVEVLLLDDVGAETDESSLEAILRARDMRLRATLVTTNLEPEQIHSSNPSLHRRLTESGVIYF